MYPQYGNLYSFTENKPVRRTVFISHYKGDHDEVERFIDDFRSVFIPKVLGANDNDNFIESTNTDYVMNQIRERYLSDSTVTIVLIGKCTHSRRYVDWEIKSSLRQGEYTPNGLIGILLPSVSGGAHLPPRFQDNWKQGNTNCYARYYYYPSTTEQLRGWIEDAYDARTARSGLIVNSQAMMKYNARCRICGVTH